MSFITDGLPILLLVLLNGLFSMAEAAVVSARKARLQLLADAGNHGARTALELANAPNRFLSTIQIGITLVGIFLGAFGGTTIARDISANLAGFPALDPYRDALSLALVVVAT